jgi:hypothetical protein
MVMMMMMTTSIITTAIIIMLVIIIIIRTAKAALAQSSLDKGSVVERLGPRRFVLLLWVYSMARGHVSASPLVGAATYVRKKEAATKRRERRERADCRVFQRLIVASQVASVHHSPSNRLAQVIRQFLEWEVMNMASSGMLQSLAGMLPRLRLRTSGGRPLHLQQWWSSVLSQCLRFRWLHLACVLCRVLLVFTLLVSGVAASQVKLLRGSMQVPAQCLRSSVMWCRCRHHRLHRSRMLMKHQYSATWQRPLFGRGHLY